MTTPSSGTSVLEVTEIDPATGSARVSHIVKQTKDHSAKALVMEAMFNGTEVEALCGHRWVPSRDPKQFPVCPRCVEVYESNVDPSQGLPDA